MYGKNALHVYRNLSSIVTFIVRLKSLYSHMCKFYNLNKFYNLIYYAFKIRVFFYLIERYRNILHILRYIEELSRNTSYKNIRKSHIYMYENNIDEFNENHFKMTNKMN